MPKDVAQVGTPFVSFLKSLVGNSWKGSVGVMIRCNVPWAYLALMILVRYMNTAYIISTTMIMHAHFDKLL